MSKKVFGLFRVGFDWEGYPSETLEGLFAGREGAVTSAPQALEGDGSRAEFFARVEFDSEAKYLVEELEVQDEHGSSG